MAVKWIDKNAPEPEKPKSVADLRKALDEAKSAQAALADEIEAYREENAVKDIPNNMELKRVTLETNVESARLALSEKIKEDAGKDPLLGESQATALKPEKSAKASKKGKGK